ncbi:MAG: CRISPR-associated endonuclease Cas1 [Candidatus Thorarchaeota archaeon]
MESTFSSLRARERYPLLENEIKEVVLRSGNSVSTGALASLGFWDIDVMVMTGRGRPVALLKSLDDDASVKTRLCQYEAYNGEKGIEIAKQIVLAKIQGQNLLLEKYDLKPHDVEAFKEKIDGIDSEDREKFRQRLNGFEGKYSEGYLKQLFSLIPEDIRPERRKKFKAYDGVNNLFNLGYEVLQWRVHRAIIKAKLEPYLGFLHSVQHGKPSLVCDLEELYRYLIDDFIVDYCQGLGKRDFVSKAEDMSRSRRGRREYLNGVKTREFMVLLDDLFDSIVEIPRMKRGSRQSISSLINEEALILGKYLRKEEKMWIPRIPIVKGGS